MESSSTPLFRRRATKKASLDSCCESATLSEARRHVRGLIRLCLRKCEVREGCGMDDSERQQTYTSTRLWFLPVNSGKQLFQFGFELAIFTALVEFTDEVTAVFEGFVGEAEGGVA